MIGDEDGLGRAIAGPSRQPTANFGPETLHCAANGHQPLDTARIERALADLAELIESRPEGDAYWPIFERLERERDARRSRDARLRQARRAGPQRD